MGISFIFRTDVHVADKSPVSWKGDYPAEIWNSLGQIGAFARRYNCQAVLDGGDYFHVKAPTRNSHRLVAQSAVVQAGYPCPTYCVEGNHDIKSNNLETISEQPLGVLYETGVFQHLRDVSFENEGVRVRVVGFPYSITRTLEELRSVKKQDGEFLVAVVHALAGESPPDHVQEFFGEPVFRYKDLVYENGPDVWCFPPDSPILDPLYRPMPIQDVTPNLRVAGREGPTAVEAVHPARNIKEELVTLYIEGIPPLIRGVTTEHPYWVSKGMKCKVPSRSDRSCHPGKELTSHPCTSCEGPEEPSPGWVAAKDIQVGDFVSLPIPKIPQGAQDNPDLARLLGFYLAEGHLIRNREGAPVAGVGWSFHADEVHLHQEVKRLVLSCFGLQTHIHPAGDNCVQVCAYGEALADFCGNHGGHLAHLKEISSWVWSLSVESRLALLEAWLLGDGHSRETRVDVMGSTASQTLAFQLFFLALSAGLIPRFRVRPPQAHQNYPGYTLSFYGDSGVRLAASMGCPIPDRSKTKTTHFVHEGLLFARVRSVGRSPYEGPVHNFRTTSEEYLAGGVLVHNCFGHWHRDQGIVRLEGRTFVNQGSVSRGSLVKENLTRTPKVALLEFTKSGYEVASLPLQVAPAAEVFDVERKERQDQETKSIEIFVDRIQQDLVVDETQNLEDVIGTLDFSHEVGKAALEYLKAARGEG